MKPNQLIVLSFGLFMAFIITLVVKTYYVNTELVSEDYYLQELSYQKKIDKQKRAKQDSAYITWQVTTDEIVLQFPASSEKINGKIQFYRPSDASKDFSVAIQLDDNQRQALQKKIFLTGLYKMTVDWSEKGKEYQIEEDIFMQ